MNHDDTTADDLQWWIDGLLQSSEAAELEATPAAVRGGVAAGIATMRRRKVVRRSLVGLATAAAAFAAVAAWHNNTPLPRREGPGEGFNAPLVVQTPEARHDIEHPSPNPSLQGRGMPTAAFVTNGDAIAVPLASDDPAVTVVQLYPTTTTERRWRRELSLYAGSSGQDGG